MPVQKTNRRDFIKLSSITAAAGVSLACGVHSSVSARQTSRSPNAKLGVGSIGLRYQGSVIALQASGYGKIVALCDVDRNVREQARASFGSTPRIFEDYRDLIKRKDIDVITIGTPDHWHTKMVVDACRAGKDIYVEKPLTLTINEGKILAKVVKETGRVVQVGSWQRSDHRFRLAVELVRQGRIGKLKKVDIVFNSSPTGGPFQQRKPPAAINWNLWQGQTPNVPYIEQRCHYTFRWWQEYSGGVMTDWGAHHLDIGQWGIGALPVEVDAHATLHNEKNSYNVPTDHQVSYKYENGVTMNVGCKGRNGIMFTGTKGRIFVNRGTISGKPVEELKNHPLPRKQFQIYTHDNLSRPQRVGKIDAIVNHMGNFFDCIKTRKQPISDVQSQHRSVSTCHLANISIRLGRRLKWDPVKEQFTSDQEANKLLEREQRKRFEVV